MLASTAVHPTAGFQDGSWPGRTVVAWAMNGRSANKAPNPTRTTSAIAVATGRDRCARDTVSFQRPQVQLGSKPIYRRLQQVVALTRVD